MLKIVYPVCCGMDVHKSFVYACIASTKEQGITTYKSKRFSTFTKDLRFCAEWLLANNCKNICMESTGKYWIPVYNILETDCKIVLAHPKYVKAILSKETEKKMPNGLQIFSSTILFQEVSSLPQIFVSFGIWFAIVGSSLISPLVRRTERRTVSPFPTSNSMTFSPMYSARLPPTS